MPLRIGLGCLAVLTLAMFFDMLVAPGSRVLGDSVASAMAWVAWIVAVFFLWRRKRLAGA